MIGCLWTRVCKQSIIALYFESETVLRFYNLEAWSKTLKTGPEIIKPFMLNSTEHEFTIAHKKLKCWKLKIFLGFKYLDAVFIMLINVKMPKFAGILTFTSMMTFVLSWVEHENSFITSGPGLLASLSYALIQTILHAISLYCKLPGKYMNTLARRLSEQQFWLARATRSLFIWGGQLPHVHVHTKPCETYHVGTTSFGRRTRSGCPLFLPMWNNYIYFILRETNAYLKQMKMVLSQSETIWYQSLVIYISLYFH